MIQHWRETVEQCGDVVLGWLLWLPRDGALFLLVALTLVILWAARRLMVSPGRLQLLRSDERQLRVLHRQARHTSDRDTLARVRRNKSAVARLRLAVELAPALVSTVPVTLLLIWAAARLDYFPADGTSAEVVMRTPVADVGKVVHLVPDERLVTESTWIQPIQLVEFQGRQRGESKWSFRCSQPGPRSLQFRFGDRTLVHSVQIGGRYYLPPRQRHGDELETTVILSRYRPFGLISPWAGFPPWLLGYLTLLVTAIVISEYGQSRIKVSGRAVGVLLH